MRKEKTITLHDINDITTFVRLATLVEEDIDVQSGRYIVDGKSIMGIMSIDISKPCKITYPEDATAFEDFLIQFEI